MDYEKELNRLPFQSSIPSYLISGPHEHTLALIIQWLQKIICPHQGCSVCTICRQIRTQQYHAIEWLYPEKQYTLEQINIIAERSAYSTDESFFFVIQKAHTLSSACSNRLLKILEEPPAHYHFVLATEQLHEMLPTIRSRCVELHLGGTARDEHPLLPFFYSGAQDPLAFMSLLEEQTPTERETPLLVDRIFTYWAHAWQQGIIKKDSKEKSEAERLIEILKMSMLTPPMPGSSKLFWRNLFLQFHALRK